MTPSPSSSPESHHRPRNASLMRQRFRSGRRYIEDVHWAWVGEISQRTVDDLKAHIEELSSTRRGDSFSSIDSVATRHKFRTAIQNIKHGILSVERSGCTGKSVRFVTTMDSPPDLSPNAPPTGFEDTHNYFANLQAPPAPASTASTGQASTEGSVDSSGFEKVDHDVLEEYGQQFVNEMQQALFGKPHDEADASGGFGGDQLDLDAGFLLVGRQSFRMTDQDVIHVLERTAPEIDEAPPITGRHHHDADDDDDDDEKQEMSSHGPHDDVLEKTYGDLIDIPRSEPSHPEPPKHTDGDHSSTDSKQNTMNSFDLLGDVHDPKPVPTVPEQQPTPVYDHYHGAHDEAPFEPVGRGGVPLDQLIEDQVAEVHGDVDEVLHRMQETDEYKLPEPKEEEHHRHKEDRYTHRDEDSDSDQPDFRSQTPEAEESTFNRRGPLTIPEVPEKLPSPTQGEFSDLEQPDISPIRGGFETHPRPPTPPKDISEELVKPSAFSLAPQHTPTHSHHDGLHSILKQSSSHYGAAEPWFDFKTVDPHILELLYWRDPKKSAVALSLVLLTVIIFARYPIISVLAYAGLAVLAGTVGFRVFKTIESQVKKTGAENPFQDYLAKDVELPQDRIHAQVDVLAEHAQLLVNQVKRLVFVENIVDSVKFALILWALTYIGYWFSGFAIVVLAVLGAFSVPKIYEMYKEPIDAQLAMVSEHISKASKMAEDKLPFLKKTPVEVEKKDQ